MKLTLTPLTRISLTIAATAFLLQWLVMGYLSGLASRQMTQSKRQWQIQVMHNLAAQLDRALAQADDLSALAIINSDKKNFAQLQTLMVFDRKGQIKLHSTPGMMGKQTDAPPDLTTRGMAIESTTVSDRPVTKITLMLPENNDFYVRAYFDNTRARLTVQTFHSRFYLFILLTSSSLGLLSAWLLKSYIMINPRQKVVSTVNPQSTLYALADLAMAPGTLIIIDRDNKILALNPKILEGSTFTAAHFLGQHLIHTPINPSFLQALQRAAKAPQEPQTTTLALVPDTSVHPVTLVCHPASAAWQLMIGQAP